MSMTPKERLLTTMRGGIPDHVPVSPDISVMVPDRLTGRPFYEIHLDGREHNGWTSATHAEAYIDAVKYFDMDGFYMYGGLKQIGPEERYELEEEILDHPDGKLVKRWCETPKGTLTEEELFYADEPPWKKEKQVKDLHEDFPKVKLNMGESEWEWEEEYNDRDKLGDLGVYLGMIPVFQDWWFDHRQGGFEQVFYDMMYEPKYMDEVYEFWSKWAIANVEAMVKAKPDLIMIGGSSASLSVSSPTIFRKYELPFIQKTAEICKQGDVVSHLHVCGKSRELVDIVANETDVQVMEPLEEPPTGNVDIGEVKRLYGDDLVLKGNLNTTEFMLEATPKEMEEKCKRVIDAAGENGGFILSTGDQCGRDTPDANLFKMVEVAKTYGKY